MVTFRPLSPHPMFRSPDQDAGQFIDLFRRFYGPTMNAFDAAERNGQVDDLHQQLLELAKGHNERTDGGASISATFLRVTVRR